MNYTYTIRKVDPAASFLGVIYHAEGRPDYFKNFRVTDFSAASVGEAISSHAPVVREYWESLESPTAPEVSEGNSGSGTAYREIREPQPEFDQNTQRLEPTETIDAAAGTKTYGWSVVDLPEAEAMENLVARAAADRYAKEGEGVYWTDPADGTVIYLDTTSPSQARFAAARTAVEGGDRVDGAVWKCADVTSGSPVITFRPTTNAELTEWSQLVLAHVQKCFEAEAIAVRDILRGTPTSFEDAFATL